MTEITWKGEGNLRLRVVAVRLGVSVKTIRRYIAAGHLAAIRLPSGHYRITQAALDAYQAAQRAADGVQW